MRVGARGRGFSITAAEARAVRFGLVPIWLSPFVRANAGDGGGRLYGLHYPSLHLPSWSVLVANLLIVAGCLAILAAGRSAAVRNHRLPPAMAALPIIAMVLWWLPAAYNPVFYATVPLFHSLQYLPFATKVRRSELSESRSPERVRRGLVIGFVGLIGTGWLAFEVVPGLLDESIGSPGQPDLFFFLLAATLFLNIHHYLVDHVIWRFDSSMVRDHLLR
jgi:hypothetical protein